MFDYQCVSSQEVIHSDSINFMGRYEQRHVQRRGKVLSFCFLNFGLIGIVYESSQVCFNHHWVLCWPRRESSSNKKAPGVGIHGCSLLLFFLHNPSIVYIPEDIWSILQPAFFPNLLYSIFRTQTNLPACISFLISLGRSPSKAPLTTKMT